MDDLEKREVFNSVLGDLTNINLTTNPREGLEVVVNSLTDGISYYNRIGFLMVNPENQKELVSVSPLEEPITPRQITLGTGIFGRVGASRNSIIISDISSEPNYEPYELSAKSAVILPIIKDNLLLGELIVESHTSSAFNVDDQAFLIDVCKLIAGLFRDWRGQLQRFFKEE